MMYSKKVSVWPVGLVGYLRYERPIVNNGKLHELESEAKLAPVNYRTQMLGKIRHYRNDIDHYSRIMGHQSLQRATKSIARSHQIAAETDQIGVEIIDELSQQRETLVKTRDRLTETDANLVKS
nr:vesicle transport through interaction with t-SNAREs-like protein 1B-like; partial [Biomphalaria glabrata]